MKTEIYTCLSFNQQAQEAAEFYCSIFKNSKITDSNPLVVMLDLNGKKIMCLNTGTEAKFSAAISLVVNCETQEDIDYYWDKLTSNGGKESRCGWLQDKFGVSWQIVPNILPKLMSNPNRAKRVMEVYMNMTKFDIERLKNA